MKYNLVTIRPNEDDWEVSFTPIPQDRVNKKQYPNPLGFYYFPRHIGKETAFNTLKEFLLKKYSIEIESLLKKREKLKKLTILN